MFKYMYCFTRYATCDNGSALFHKNSRIDHDYQACHISLCGSQKNINGLHIWYLLTALGITGDRNSKINGLLRTNHSSHDVNYSILHDYNSAPLDAFTGTQHSDLVL
jgi:hypothetical protein